MVCDFLFPAAFLLFVQVSHRDKQEPGDSKKSQTTFNDDSSAQATQRSQRRGKKKEEEEWGFNGILGDLLSEFVLADWDETADEG